MNEKKAISFLLETSVIGIMHGCGFQVTETSKDILDDILRASKEAGLEIEEIIAALKDLEKRFQKGGKNVSFEFEYEDNMRQ